MSQIIGRLTLLIVSILHWRPEQLTSCGQDFRRRYSNSLWRTWDDNHSTSKSNNGYKYPLQPDQSRNSHAEPIHLSNISTQWTTVTTSCFPTETSTLIILSLLDFPVWVCIFTIQLWSSIHLELIRATKPKHNTCTRISLQKQLTTAPQTIKHSTHILRCRFQLPSVMMPQESMSAHLHKMRAGQPNFWFSHFSCHHSWISSHITTIMTEHYFGLCSVAIIVYLFILGSPNWSYVK